jgi:hypothetical protein
MKKQIISVLEYTSTGQMTRNNLKTELGISNKQKTNIFNRTLNGLCTEGTINKLGSHSVCLTGNTENKSAKVKKLYSIIEKPHEWEFNIVALDPNPLKKSLANILCSKTIINAISHHFIEISNKEEKKEFITIGLKNKNQGFSGQAELQIEDFAQDVCKKRKQKNGSDTNKVCMGQRDADAGSEMRGTVVEGPFNMSPCHAKIVKFFVEKAIYDENKGIYAMKLPFKFQLVMFPDRCQLSEETLFNCQKFTTVFKDKTDEMLQILDKWNIVNELENQRESMSAFIKNLTNNSDLQTVIIETLGKKGLKTIVDVLSLGDKDIGTIEDECKKQKESEIIEINRIFLTIKQSKNTSSLYSIAATKTDD